MGGWISRAKPLVCSPLLGQASSAVWVLPGSFHISCPTLKCRILHNTLEEVCLCSAASSFTWRTSEGGWCRWLNIVLYSCRPWTWMCPGSGTGDTQSWSCAPQGAAALCPKAAPATGMLAAGTQQHIAPQTAPETLY